ncbi:MAG: bifunctional 5,10-methylene-tetrahydrofolate dehydrogenase/5,10-methylene-tetrahydrofolate cyclohydrolase [Treponema sp.]|nr:bifunctional 5,10-methylene-tetrahydrofolate dehydrogenase/5,10-methylene-tetrahydrofolate cyclohydrolase [Treponema sp.]
MSAIIIDGKITAAKIQEKVRKRTAALKEKGIVPCLAVILAGEDPASVSYVTSKKKALEEIGMEDREIRLPGSVSEAELLGLIASLNADPKVHGILVQHPFPRHMDEERIFSAVNPDKDVDGFSLASAGNLALGRPGFIPGTPFGIVHLLRDYQIPIAGRHVVILGRSNIVGKPMANLLVRRELNATVTVCHTGTPDPAVFTRQADIIIAAAGKPGLVTADMVKPGAAVIDVGMNRVPDASKKKGYRLCGDTDYEGLLEIAGWITKVPGGVGPMTVAMLTQNVADAAEDIHTLP